jgi:predicted enzyme related to lactoylglutathione lyase
MHGDLAHFAINADDLPATRRFYEALFGWELKPWGPPGFFRTPTPSGSVVAALQARRELVPGMRGLECTFAVDDADVAAAAVARHGGRVVMATTTIPGVGDLVFFEDPSGNVAGARRYA